MNTEERFDTAKENLLLSAERLEIILKQNTLCAKAFANILCERYPELTAETLSDELRLNEISSPLITAFVCQAVSDMQKRSSKNESERIVSLLGMRDSAVAGSHGKIAFVRNRYNDLAFESFSYVVSNAKVSYARTFSEACEDVANGRSEYALLPISNSNDGRLFNFYSLIDRYGLRICAVNEIEPSDSDSSVGYALVGRTLPKIIKNTESCCLEFSLTRENERRLGEFLLAASEIGANPKRIDTLPVEYDDKMARYYFTFELPCSQAYAFALFVMLQYPSYTPIGFYSNEY